MRPGCVSRRIWRCLSDRSFLNAVFAEEELQLDGRDDGSREGAAGRVFR